MDYGPYDYGSIMHYGKTAFGKKAANGTKLKTIVPKPNPNVSIGQRTGLSKLDIDGINHLYAKAFLPGWAELARHGVPASKYQGEFSKITALGYRPVWIDGYDVNGKTYFNVIFRRANGKAWVARHGLSGSKYQKEFKKWTKLGYRLAHVESYKSSGNVRYAAIFVKTSGPA